MNAAGTPELIHFRFEQQASLTPDALAVISPERQLTFQQLDEEANALARHLRRLGVAGPEQRVGICLERSADMIVGLLAILKAGAAYLPLDPSYPPQALAYMIDDASPRAILTHSELKDRLVSSRPLILVDEHWRRASDGSGVAPSSPAVSPHNLAYVIYTSGSTGRPKGVMVEHRNVTWLWRALEERIYTDHAACQRVAVNASIAFDSSVKQLIQVLSGRTLCMIPQSIRIDPGQLLQFVIHNEIDCLDCTPAQLATLAQAGLFESSARFPNVVLVGGEAISAALWERMATSRSVSFFNVYGPTECTVDVTVTRIAEASEPRLGKPLSGAVVYTIDEHQRRVATGIGEICIGGGGVARGYLNQPALTAEKFLADPFSAAPEARVYRTGDLGEWIEDGQLVFRGRNDQQVKIRGFRVELQEIQRHLTAFAGVKDAVVVTFEEPDRDKKIVAYVVTDAPEIKRSYGNATDVVYEWAKVHDDIYAAASGRSAVVNWHSTLSSEPVPPEELREWVEHTVATVKTLRPRRVLEIGCGLGLLLEELAPACEAYHATDISIEAIEKLRRWRLSKPELKHVQLEHSAPLELFDGMTERYDTVILSAAVSYFPDLDSLTAVIERAVECLAPAGRIIITDVRQLELQRAFHSAALLQMCGAHDTVAELKRRVERALERERELVISPRFFERLPQTVPQLRQVRIEPKRGVYDNEVTSYRYDVVLDTSQSVESRAVRAVSDSNARVESDSAIARLIDASDGSTPVDELASALATLAWTGEEMCGDMQTNAMDLAGRESNDPVMGAAMRQFVSTLQDSLRDSLPSHMVPAAITVLDVLPLTPNGKVDKGALPPPDFDHATDASYEAPEGEIEQRLAELWQETLSLPRIGRRDNFFELGGDSLLAAKLTLAISSAFAVSFYVQMIFHCPTLAQMAEAVTASLEESELDSDRAVG